MYLSTFSSFIESLESTYHHGYFVDLLSDLQPNGAHPGTKVGTETRLPGHGDLYDLGLLCHLRRGPGGQRLHVPGYRLVSGFEPLNKF